MDVSIKIDEDTINKALMEKILESNVGSILANLVKKHMEDLTSSYNNPLNKAVKLFIDEQIRSILIANYKDVIASSIRAALTEEKIQELVHEFAAGLRFSGSSY